MKPMVVLVVLAAASTAASSANARVIAMPGWIDARTLADTLEVRGVVYEGARRPIDFAACSGLRRFGQRALGYTTAYHRFKCSLTGADEHGYSAWVTITRSIVSSTPIPGRGEPAYLARDLRDAVQELEDAREQIQTVGTVTPAQQRAREEFLRPYVEAVEDAEARLEPYRTRFWWRVTQLRRDS